MKPPEVATRNQIWSLYTQFKKGAEEIFHQYDPQTKIDARTTFEERLEHKSLNQLRNLLEGLVTLEEKNMEVFAGTNGNEALELLEENLDIAIILMDIMMPEMDGYDAIRQIRNQVRFRKLPIIALTAKAMKGDKSKCIEAGANDYLSKPVDTDKLLSLMRVWLYR